VDFSLVVRHRLEELGLEQRDLARAAKVTESYISQLLARKKAPPSPSRTDIYERLDKVLKLPGGELSRLATLQRQEELKKELADPPQPLFKEVRQLVLRKCKPGKEKQIREIFEKLPFGEVERLVTQKLLDVVKKAAKKELRNENWVRLVAELTGQSFEQMRVIILEFLDTDVFNVSLENCVSFLDPMIEFWDINLETFAMEIVLDRRVALEQPRKFEFVEREPEPSAGEESALEEFLHDSFLSGGATEEEIEFLRKLRFKGKQPTPLYYYRELQNLRDPLHFRPVVADDAG
jgi:transcriptional regulator with XRE-family HTH domain